MKSLAMAAALAVMATSAQAEIYRPVQSEGPAFWVSRVATCGDVAGILTETEFAMRKQMKGNDKALADFVGSPDGIAENAIDAYFEGFAAAAGIPSDTVEMVVFTVACQKNGQNFNAAMKAIAKDPGN